MKDFNKIPQNKKGTYFKDTCKNCGEEYFASKYTLELGKGGFCTRDCYNDYRHKIRTTNCKGCGEPFQDNSEDIKKGKGGYCCIECYKDACQEVRTCPVCKKEFSVKKSSKKITCNDECRAISRRSRVSLICKECGEPFTAHTHRSDAKFCSHECYHLSLKKLTKEKSINWQGGITALNLFIRNSEKYAMWRTSVFKRDMFVCQKCGNTGKLHAHHIKKFSILLKEMKHNLPLLDPKEAAMIYDPFWDIDNGVTMCEDCHRNFHKKGCK